MKSYQDRVCLAVSIFFCGLLLFVYITRDFNSTRQIGSNANIKEFKEYFPKYIYISSTSDSSVKEAALELASAFRLVTGVNTYVSIESSYGSKEGVYIGNTRFSREYIGYSQNSYGHDRIIHAGRSIIIRGKDEQSHVPAVYDYINRYLQVHWYMPGELGLEYPRDELRLEAYNQYEPANPFTSRYLHLSNTFSRKNVTWTRRQGHQKRYTVWHNIYSFFDEDELEHNRHWFPLIDGVRSEQFTLGRRTIWQPNMSGIGLVQHIKEELLDEIKNNRVKDFIPIAVSDSMRFGDDVWEASTQSETPIYRGAPNVSDSVFKFYDRIAQSLPREVSDKYLTVHAYYWHLLPPSINLRPQLLVFLALDRMMWGDEIRYEEDSELFARWLMSGASLGIYDYLYGSGFLIPRPLTKRHAEGIQLAAENGALAYSAEAYPIWGYDVGKMWMVGRLVQERGVDYESLQNEFYDGFYGEASPYMREFFTYAMEAWKSSLETPRWLKYREDPQQGWILEPYQEQMQQSLKLALTVSEGRFHRRVQLTQRVFDITSLMINQLADRRAFTLEPGSSTLRKYIESRAQLTAALESSDDEMVREQHDWLLREDPTNGWLGSQLLDYGAGRIGQEDFAMLLANMTLTDEAWQAVIKEAYARPTGRQNRLRNPTFETVSPLRLKPSQAVVWEDSTMRQPDLWRWHASRVVAARVGREVMPEVEQPLEAQLPEYHPLTGAPPRGAVMRFSGIDLAWLVQSLAVEGGQGWYASIDAEISRELRLAEVVELSIAWYDAEGGPLGSTATHRLLHVEADTWQRLAVGGVAPEGAAVGQFRVDLRYFEEGLLVRLGEPSMRLLLDVESLD